MLRSTTRFALAAAAMAVFTAPAFATTFTVEKVTPVPAGTTIIAEKAVWSCDGTVCTAELRRKSATVRSCKKVVKEVGAVKAYKSENNALSEEDLAKCNEAAKS